MNSSVVTVTLNPALDKTVTLAGLEIGGLNRVQNMRLDPGGKGINVAKVLKKFDVEVTAAGLIAGAQGQQLLKQVEREAIKVRFVNVQGETRTNLKVVDETTKTTTEINEPGFTVSADNLAQFRQELLQLLDAAAVLVIGGSLPPGVPEDIYRDYIELANSKGVKAILDADGQAFREGLKAKPFAVKPNIHELEELLGQKLETVQEIVSAGKALVQQGISLVIISMGSRGSIVLDEKEVYQVTPFSITPQSTVGAGDSMVAALAYSLLEAKPLAEIAILATTAGTVTASKSGTQVCTLAEVKDSLTKVHAEKL